MSPTRSTQPTQTRPTRAAKAPGRVAFVGAGPGDSGLMTVRSVDLLAAADVVVIDQVARESVVARYCGPDVEVVDAGHGDHGQPLTHAMRAKLVVKAAKSAAGGLVVRLMDGDPALFNGLAEEALACHKAGIGFDIVPGVSAVSAVPAYAGIPLTSSSSPAVHVISANDRNVDWAASAADSVTVVLLGPPEDLGAALAKLLDAGRPADSPVALTERGTTIRQSTRVTTLGEVAKVMKSVEFPALAVVGSTVAMRSELSWFETKPLF
ncbi:MAG TPA: uroporphyrinogen-III C-methyltransferase, partial [Pedococcus sp.]|nr:uroporphyrinogen-III C-methyltransferase [Pedococcus sp.]